MKKAGGYTAAIASLQRKRRKLDMIQEKIRSIIKEDFSQEVNAVDVRDGYLILSVPTVALDFRMRYLLPMLDAELRAQVPGYSKLRGLQVKTRGIFNANAANYKPKIFKSNDAGRRPPAEHAGAIRAAAMQRGVPEFLKVQLLRMAEKCEGKS